jgi:hypothetical protein
VAKKRTRRKTLARWRANRHASNVRRHLKDSAKRRRLKTAGFREAAEMAKAAKAATSILLAVSGHNGQNFRCCAQRWRWPHHLGIWLLG